jgi:hypothetical protein
MWRTYGGALMVIAGIAALIEAHSHHPVAAVPPTHLRPGVALALERPVVSAGEPASGLSPTAYDLLHIGAWALVILGGLTVLLGLIRYWRAA